MKKHNSVLWLLNIYNKQMFLIVILNQILSVVFSYLTGLMQPSSSFNSGQIVSPLNTYYMHLRNNLFRAFVVSAISAVSPQLTLYYQQNLKVPCQPILSSAYSSTQTSFHHNFQDPFICHLIPPIFIPHIL